MQPADINRLLGIVPESTRPTAEDLIVLAHIAHGERYIWLYTEAQATNVLRSFGSFAAHPELNFTWHDAAVLSQTVRRQQDAHCRGKSIGGKEVP